MSEEQLPLPPVPEHTPPLKEDELRPEPGKYFNQAWNRWFTSLRTKVNVINDAVTSLSQLVGNGIVAISGGTTTTVGLTDIIAGSNVSFDTSGAGRLIDNGDGPLTVSAVGGSGGLVTSFVVVGSAANFIEITGLDLTTAVSYRIEFSFLNSSAGNVVYRLFYNGDTTGSNYTSQGLYTGASAVSGARWTTGELIHTNTSGSLATGFINITQGVGGGPVAFAMFTRDLIATTSQMYNSHRWNNTANVTTIRFDSASANAFGIGSFVRVYLA